MNLLTQNTKLKKTSQAMGCKVLNFSLPAYKDMYGKTTCPFAGDCVKYCYAQKGNYRFNSVKSGQQRRYELTKTDKFVAIMIEEIRAKKADYIRIHDSGDFYSPNYINKWLEIAAQLPDVRFYAYTKSIRLFKGLKLPENFDIIYSIGSKDDDLIDRAKDRHADIFTPEVWDKSYINASDNDLLATKWHNENNKVGLLIH